MKNGFVCFATDSIRSYFCCSLLVCSLCLFSTFVADREVQRILLELLNQMDGFDQNVNVKVRLFLVIHYCML